ncbi:hypothetical protein C5B42_00940 [Candidatus Cerribacteria bacterium 'Amazon FNV 2010 28 9']|uniref:Uncharacterized protein n=1 Tax=Candidatus Cerribacteria bacterium 'Amazon FNV 2010 28 9' TaxID=2081795 RepID=A0A317JSH8_9BACT|nr:MAG: hypothetical protein C5B42_00940 [Candidatus Cerribacteria bacterium 'Amazon FNV 2010 28 9']
MATDKPQDFDTAGKIPGHVMDRFTLENMDMESSDPKMIESVRDTKKEIDRILGEIDPTHPSKQDFQRLEGKLGLLIGKYNMAKISAEERKSIEDWMKTHKKNSLFQAALADIQDIELSSFTHSKRAD